MSLTKGSHWSSPETFGPRARFNIDADVPALEIEVRGKGIPEYYFRMINFFLYSSTGCETARPGRVQVSCRLSHKPDAELPI